MKINKTYAKEHGIIFYPAYAYRRFPTISDIIEKYATYSGKKALKKAHELLCDDDTSTVFVKSIFNEEWYEVIKRTEDGDFIVKKESNINKTYYLSDIIKDFQKERIENMANYIKDDYDHDF